MGVPLISGGTAGASGSLVGLGIDLVDVARFAAVLARRPKLAERLFTLGERAYAGTFANPAPSLAARFAAKEAAMKALGVGLGAFAFGDVEVQREPSGAAPPRALRRTPPGWPPSATCARGWSL